MLKQIKGYKDYYIDNMGNVFSTKSGTLKEIKPWMDSQGKYKMVGLISNVDNKRHKLLIHRLVAKAFIPNPTNLPQVNHLNYNTIDNRVENLEWCTVQENLHYSYCRTPPTRNFVECDLYKDGYFIKSFNSILDAAKYGSEYYGASMSGLIRNYKSKGLTIVKTN